MQKNKKQNKTKKKNKTCLYMFIYILNAEKKLKNKVIQKEELNVKESQRSNVSVQTNHYQDKARMISSNV